jgi:hypothetical protein
MASSLTGCIGADCAKRKGQAFPLVRGVTVGLGGLEPPTSSLSAKCREPLCGRPFPQIGGDRGCRSYAFKQRSGMRSFVMALTGTGQRTSCPDGFRSGGRSAAQ